MNNKNIQFVENITKEFSKKGIKFIIIDERWKKRGDIDIIVNKDSLKQFEKILKKYNFIRKGFWPPQSRTYHTYKNNENIFIGGHIGGYIGAFGGGLGKVGKRFSPSTVPKKSIFLPNEEQLFIIIYKYHSRKDNQKYVNYYNKLINFRLNYDKLAKLMKLVFTNHKRIIQKIKNKKNIKSLNAKFKSIKRIKLALSGKFNNLLRFVYKTIKPSPYIAFVGCNGVGKSTTMEALKKKLLSEKVNVTTLYSGRFKFQILPINQLLKLFKPDKIERGKDHHKGTKREQMREVRIYKSKFLHILAPIVYYFEYLLRYLFKIYPLRIKYDIVLTDRSFLDIFNSPNTNRTTCKILFAMMPKPKHILLWNSPEVLAKRRPEFQLKHIKEQIGIYNQFSKLYLMKAKTDSYEIINSISEKLHKII